MNNLSKLLVCGASIGLLATGFQTPAFSSPSVDSPAPGEATSSLSLPLKDKDGVWIAAHRGQWRDYPENSLPAILQASDDGAEIIEIDLKKTKDGHLVLVHDATVDRTTNGTGRVEDLTLKEIKELNLLEAQGNGPAAVTDLKVPTFKETLSAVEGHNLLLNLDKGWEYREQLMAELEEAGMVDYALFKGAPNAEEAHDFMATYPEAQYMHIINDRQLDDFEEFTQYMPDAIEVAFRSPDDPQAQPEYLESINSQTDLWLNSMWDSVSGGFTDEASLRDPSLGWDALTDLGADIIQTDNVRTMDRWREGKDIQNIGLKPSTLRVQAEDFIDDPEYYWDTNDRNECPEGKAIRNPQSPVDACDLDGAHIVQYIREGEFFTLEFDVKQPGMYNMSIRHSADTDPGGTITVTTEDGHENTVHLPNTTHNRAFTVEDLGQYKFERGKHKIQFKFSHPDYMSVDWVQLDRGQRADLDLLDMTITPTNN